jgi:hypothetical protein
MDAKLDELKEKCLIAGKSFLTLVEKHHNEVPFRMLNFSYETILSLYRYNRSYEYYVMADSELMRNGSRLIAFLAKKYEKLGERLAKSYGLKFDVAKTEEKKLALLLLNM